MFPTLEEYQNFVNAKLKPWQNTLEFKYFNSMYRHQRSTTESIKKLYVLNKVFITKLCSNLAKKRKKDLGHKCRNYWTKQIIYKKENPPLKRNLNDICI